MHKIVINTILLLIFCIMSFSLYKVLNSRAFEESNVAKLRDLYNTEVSLNKQLSQQYVYYNSNEYIEKVSRDNLNLAKQGEFLVVLPDNGQGNPTQAPKAISVKSNSNLQDWINLFLQ